MTINQIIIHLKMVRDLYNFNPISGEPIDEDCKNKVKILNIAINALERLIE